VRKHDGANIRQLSVSNIKQIAGRAGRYRSAFQDTKSTQTPGVLDDVLDSVPSDPLTPNPLTLGSTPISVQKSPTSSESLSPIPFALDAPSLIPDVPNSTNEQKSICPAPLVPPRDLQNKSTRNVGYVTTLEKNDFSIVKRAMESTAPPLRTAGILPTDFIIKRFAKYFPPGTPFSYVLLQLNEIAQVSNRFHICDLKDKLILADAIHHVKNLTIEDRLLLCLVPVSVGKERHVQDYFVDLATAVSEQKGGGLLELPHLDLEVLDETVKADHNYLKRVEGLHKMLVAYLWLSFRFPGVFTTRPLAMHVKEIVEDVIAKSLSMFNFSEAKGKKRRQLERKMKFLDQLHRDMLEQMQLGIDQARQNTELELREASEETLKEAKVAADELHEEEGFEDEDFKETEETLTDGRTFREESQHEWGDEDECELDEMEANLITRNTLETVPPQNGVTLGSATFDSPAEDLKPFDIGTQRSDQAFVHDAEPLYYRSTP
jgi:ATP-dependent RNA helicase SUPV3L1/SUV3